jgi:hypothetical protein
LTLFKSYKFLLEDKIEDSKKLLKEYKRIYTSCKFKDHHPIFNTTKNLYYYLKIKIDFHNNAFFKCYKHLNNLINPSLTKQNKLNEAIKILYDIYDYGYSVIDILDYFFTFVKMTSIIDEETKYRIIPFLCKYITIFHNIHEDCIELALFTNNLSNLI